jgi:hypothetical protein
MEPETTIKPTEESNLNSKLEAFYNSYYLSNIQKFAVGKFLKDFIGDKSNQKVSRTRPWFFEALNGRSCKAESEG